MSKISKTIRVLALAVAALAAFGAWAETETVGEYTWTYRINGDTAEIYGDYYSAATAISPKPIGAVTIPATLGGYLVTSIGQYAFYLCNGLTSVTIPDSVTSIRSSAFSGCSGLMDVVVPQSVCNSGMSSVFPSAYQSITNVVISGSVTSIGQYAFYLCSGLTSVTIPDSVTSIGSSAFSGCNGLADANGFIVVRNVLYGYHGADGAVTIPDGVTSIGGGAFRDCSGLTSVTMPDSVTSIGWSAFEDCSSLVSVTIPNSVECIGECAFACSGLINLTIPNSVTSIGRGAFYKCQNLANVTIGNGLKELVDGYAPDDDRDDSGVFAKCSSLTNVVFGNNMTHIGKYTFEDCSNLICGTIPVGVTSIGPDSFYGCDKIWADWFKTLANASAAGGGGSGGGSASVVTTVVQQVESPYALTNVAADRAIASVTVDDDCAIDSFVLKAGEVYDAVLRIVNTANRDVTLTLSAGHVYETFEGINPLKIPANSTNILTITRTEANTFLVSREKLRTIQQ